MNDFYNLKLIINKELSAQRLDKALTKSLDNYSSGSKRNHIKSFS